MLKVGNLPNLHCLKKVGADFLPYFLTHAHVHIYSTFSVFLSSPLMLSIKSNWYNLLKRKTKFKFFLFHDIGEEINYSSICYRFSVIRTWLWLKVHTYVAISREYAAYYHHITLLCAGFKIFQMNSVDLFFRLKNCNKIIWKFFLYSTSCVALTLTVRTSLMDSLQDRNTLSQPSWYVKLTASRLEKIVKNKSF